MKRSTKRACAVLALCLVAGSLPLAWAQGMPGGMGRMGGGMGPGGDASSQRREAKAPDDKPLEDRLPPDPWRLWHERLAAEAGALHLGPAQAGPFQEFLAELDEVQQLRARRVTRLLHPRPPVVSAVTDVARDLRLEREDAQDWFQALQDLERRWQALLVVLVDPAQRARVEASYAEAQRAGAVIAERR